MGVADKVGVLECTVMRRSVRALGALVVLCAAAVGAWPRTASAEAPGANDTAKNLVEALTLTRLADMHSLRSASLPESPWSGDYWALYRGEIACRYSDPAMVYTSDWKANVDALRNTTPANPNDLSPAKKYDLLVGDAAQTLTNFNLDSGKQEYKSTGVVESSRGIGHGWAMASYMMLRPLKTIVVTAADGVTQLKFFPDDIKALASALWAHTTPQTRFIGSRCNIKNPATEGIGRIKDSTCRDTNAGTWHLAVVNQIGKNQRSLVLDSTYDYEVSSHPVYSYSYTYFNAKTKLTYSTLSYARLAVSDFPEDKFKPYRAAGTTHIVGINMDVKWTVTRPASHAAPDGPANDPLSGVRLMYTLELDANGTIIGGEWLQSAHPDFLWTPPPGTTASAPYEGGATGTWSGQTAMPASWRTAAAQSSASGAPLNAIVGKLIELSRL